MLHIVGIDDAAVAAIMFLPQQRIQRIDAPRQFVAMQGAGGQRLPELVEIPFAAFDTLSQLVDLLPLQDT